MRTCPSLSHATTGKAGNAQSQALFESYARLQQLRGQQVTIPPGTSSTSEQTSRVVGIIEAVLRGSGGDTELRQAMKILQVCNGGWEGRRIKCLCAGVRIGWLVVENYSM
jgi:hypothetical protein